MDAGARTSDNGRILDSLQRTLTSPEPLEALAALTTLRSELDAFEREQVRRALENGYSYSAVARGLGISRQAAHRRYRSLRTAESLREAVRRARVRSGAPRLDHGRALRPLYKPGFRNQPRAGCWSA